MFLEIILISTISTGFGIGIGVFFNKIKNTFFFKKNNSIIVNSIMNNIYTIHYQINNINYSIVVDTSLSKQIYNLPIIKDVNGNDITNDIENYIRGISSVIPKDKIIPLHLNLKNILVEDTEITYHITSKSSLFGLTGI